MSTNWVERRALRQKNLIEQSDKVWEDARMAIIEACSNFKTFFSELGDVECTPKNGKQLMVEVRIKEEKRRVRIERLWDYKIAVTVDDKPTVDCAISSDETHAYILHGQNEINPDEFSKLILEKPFFDPPKPWKAPVQASGTRWT